MPLSATRLSFRRTNCISFATIAVGRPVIQPPPRRTQRAVSRTGLFRNSRFRLSARYAPETATRAFGATGGPPPARTGDGWRGDGRRRPGGVAGGRRNSGGTPGPLNRWNPSVLLSGGTRERKKRPRRDLTGAAFCGMLWATSAPLWPAWRQALCRCRNHRRGRFYLER